MQMRKPLIMLPPVEQRQRHSSPMNHAIGSVSRSRGRCNSLLVEVCLPLNRNPASPQNEQGRAEQSRSSSAICFERRNQIASLSPNKERDILSLD